tara:strand:- start:1046 stop:1651 length:606 start_codon:yes stop_codon:yes gene_type:complete
MALVKYNNNSISAITSAAAIPSGAMTLIKTLTADGSGTTVTFDSDIDSTYPIYLFKLINIHGATDDKNLQVNFRDGGSAYDATKTSTTFNTYHSEIAGDPELAYTNQDVAQGTGVQSISPSVGADNDEGASGELWLFNPSSTVFVKHFTGNFHSVHKQPASINFFVAGYCNVTAAIDGVQFSMASGNLDSGTFKMYGIKDS